MKNMIKFLGVIALVAVIGFSMAGCKEDETASTPQTVTYKGTAPDSKTYVLTINETDGTYELTVGGKTSKGSATKSGSTWTLTPTGGKAFTVTVSSSGITDIKGEITFTDGSKEDAPPTITPPAPPVTGNDPLAGTWTIDSDDGGGHPVKIKVVAASGAYSYYWFSSNIEIMRGTYTFSGNTVTLTVTQVNLYNWGQTDQANEWISYANLPDNIRQNMPQTSQVTITGNTFTDVSGTWSKQ